MSKLMNCVWVFTFILKPDFLTLFLKPTFKTTKYFKYNLAPFLPGGTWMSFRGSVKTLEL